MRDRPTAEQLLTLARRILREDLLSHLPKDQRYQGLMVANAMAIAARQAAYGDGPARLELARIAALFGDVVEPETAADLTTELERYHRRLCADIRAGRLDPGGPEHEAVQDLLLEHARQKVRESNPKYLD